MTTTSNLANIFRKVLAEHEYGALGGTDLAEALAQAAFEARHVDEAALAEFLNLPAHAPQETHSRADGSCLECPWPVYQLPPTELARAIGEWLRGGK